MPPLWSLINSWNLEMPAPGPWLAGGKGRRGLEEGVHPESRGRLWLYQERTSWLPCLSCPTQSRFVRFHFISEITLRGFWPVSLEGRWVSVDPEDPPLSIGSLFWVKVSKLRLSPLPWGPQNTFLPWLLTFWPWVAFLLLPSLDLALRSWGQGSSSPDLLGCRSVWKLGTLVVLVWFVPAPSCWMRVFYFSGL